MNLYGFNNKIQGVLNSLHVISEDSIYFITNNHHAELNFFIRKCFLQMD